MFITDNHALFHLGLKENLIKHQKVSEYYDHDRRLTLCVNKQDRKQCWKTYVSLPLHRLIMKHDFYHRHRLKNGPIPGPWT